MVCFKFLAFSLTLCSSILCEDFKIGFHTSLGKDSGTSRYPQINITGTTGDIINKECEADFSKPGSIVSCTIKDDKDIGTFKCVYVKNYDPRPYNSKNRNENLYIDRLKVESLKNNKEKVFYGTKYIWVNRTQSYCGTLGAAEPIPEEYKWIPKPLKGRDVLGEESGFFYWLFQCLALPPFFALLMLIFGIIACVRGKVCPCCNKEGQKLGTHTNFVPVQSQGQV